MTENKQHLDVTKTDDSIDSDSAFHKEWYYQQAQFDSYEKHSLLIKLVHLMTGIFILNLQPVTITLILFGLLFWLVDAIWKTFQFRIEDRILLLESAINSSQTDCVACQYNSEFIKNKPGTLAMFATYGKNALRPTVALPHVVIIGWYFALLLCQ